MLHNQDYQMLNHTNNTHASIATPLRKFKLFRGRETTAKQPLINRADRYQQLAEDFKPLIMKISTWERCSLES